MTDFHNIGQNLLHIGQEAVCPVLNLFEPSYRALEVIGNIGKVWVHIKETTTKGYAIDATNIFQTVVKTTTAAILAIGFITHYEAAFVATISIDLVNQIDILAHSIISDDSQAAFKALSKTIADVMYLIIEIISGPHIAITLSIVCILADLWEAGEAFDEKRSLNGVAYLVRTMIRVKRAI